MDTISYDNAKKLANSVAQAWVSYAEEWGGSYAFCPKDNTREYFEDIVLNALWDNPEIDIEEPIDTYPKGDIIINSHTFTISGGVVAFTENEFEKLKMVFTSIPNSHGRTELLDHWSEEPTGLIRW